LTDLRGVAEDALHFKALRRGFEILRPSVHHAAGAVNLLHVEELLSQDVVGVVQRQLQPERFLQGLTPRRNIA